MIWELCDRLWIWVLGWLMVIEVPFLAFPYTAAVFVWACLIANEGRTHVDKS